MSRQLSPERPAGVGLSSWCWLISPFLVQIQKAFHQESLPAAIHITVFAMDLTSTVQMPQVCPSGIVKPMAVTLSLKCSNDFLHPWHLAELAVSDNVIYAHSKGIWILAKILHESASTLVSLFNFIAPLISRSHCYWCLFPSLSQLVSLTHF